jgi:hypothetical protein
MRLPKAILVTTRGFVAVLICTVPAVPSRATSGIVLRSRYRIVLAADSRATYSGNERSTECKLFEVQNVYATVSGLAHYGRSYRVTDTIREGFSGRGTFENHVASTAMVLKRTVENLLADLQANDPDEYRYVMQRPNANADLVELAVAQTIGSQPMLGIIELRRDGSGNTLTARTIICAASCRQSTQLFYLGYWEHIKPYVGTSGRRRAVGSAASIDKLIRLEVQAHPNEVSAPINILELSRSGARWLQNGGNCWLPGVGW